MTVQTQSTTSRQSHINQPDDDLFVIHGVAIGENDVTLGHKSKTRKRWPKKALEGAAETLQGRHIVKNHENRDIDAVIGQVTHAQYKEGVGVLYQGVINDEETAEKIENDWLDVSPRMFHTDEMEEDENGTKVVQNVIAFDNLGIVRQGAAPSNSVQTGESELLSSEELQQAFGYDEAVVEELREIEIDVEEFEENIDLSKYAYDNAEGAQGAAEDLACDVDYHQHELDGDEVYMPCENHNTLIEAIAEGGEEEASDAEEPEEEVEEEELQTAEEEKKRIAGQISSWSPLKREEAFELLETLDPDAANRDGAIVTAISRSYNVDEGEVTEALSEIIENSSMNNPEDDPQNDSGSDSPLDRVNWRLR